MATLAQELGARVNVEAILEDAPRAKSNGLGDPVLAAAIAHLPAIRAEVAGCLSAAERALAAPPRDTSESARGVYRRALERATDARYALSTRLADGLPHLRELPGGGSSGMAGVRHAEIRRLINSYVRASRLLHGAAQLVCDVDELDDDGEREGIVWEVPL